MDKHRYGALVLKPAVDQAWHFRHNIDVMTCIGKVSKGAVKLPPGVNLPDGTAVEVVLPDRKNGAAHKTSKLEPGWFAKRYKKYIGCIKDGPPDLAENHDHYAHGALKRSKP